MIRQVLPQDHVPLMTNMNAHVWHHVTNHLIISNDKDFNTEKQKKIYVSVTLPPSLGINVRVNFCKLVWRLPRQGRI
jgi:hypothetical protein